MPHVVVKLRSGYSRAHKDRLAATLAASVADTLDCPMFDVSIGIEDVAPNEWSERVYEPDIRDKPATIYKQPGYASAT